MNGIFLILSCLMLGVGLAAIYLNSFLYVIDFPFSLFFFSLFLIDLVQMNKKKPLEQVK